MSLRLIAFYEAGETPLEMCSRMGNVATLMIGNLLTLFTFVVTIAVALSLRHRFGGSAKLVRIPVERSPVARNSAADTQLD